MRDCDPPRVVALCAACLWSRHRAWLTNAGVERTAQAMFADAQPDCASLARIARMPLGLLMEKLITHQCHL